MNDPVFLLLGLGVASYFLWLWWSDLQSAQKSPPGQSPSGGLPGARPSTANAIIIGIVGAVLLVGLETWGELALNISSEQSEITVLFALYSILGAAIVEELVFRGFVVVDDKGRGWLIASALGASIVFALAHPHVWQWEDGQLTWHFDTKGYFSTACLFLSSLWFYACRFAPWNKNQSLLPCFTAHAAKNLAVVLVKAAQGFVVALW
jgi:uncharacterized protein